jgi:hypothetical protein
MAAISIHKENLNVSKYLFSAIALLTILKTSVSAEEATVLSQADAPLEITKYANHYKSPDRIGDGTVLHRPVVKNSSEKIIVAYGIGFYIFDAFKRDMDRPFIGYTMSTVPVSQSDAPRWEQRPNSAFLFQNYGHGLAYVAIVRFEDGTIWKADESSIIGQLEDFEFELESSASTIE